MSKSKQLAIIWFIAYLVFIVFDWLTKCNTEIYQSVAIICSTIWLAADEVTT